MKELFIFIKQELTSVILILVSLLPIFFIGAFLDIALTQFYAYVENGKTTLPAISQWVYESIAGYRFLPQEIMVCIWALMVILFILNAFFTKDRQQFRLRFIYSFLLTWILVVTFVSLMIFTCVSPFDLLFSRLEESGWFHHIIRIILLFELMLVILIPAGFAVWLRRSAGSVKELK
jgi:hypothetical protein